MLKDDKPSMRKSSPRSVLEAEAVVASLEGRGDFGSTNEASAALSYSLSSEPEKCQCLK